jgi:hypothetical protein
MDNNALFNKIKNYIKSLLKDKFNDLFKIDILTSKNIIKILIN